MTMVLILGLSCAFRVPVAAWIAATCLVADALLTVVSRLYLVPRDARRNYRSVKAASEDFYAELNEGGLHITNALSSQQVPWNHVLQWRHDESLVLIYTAPRFFFVIPKRIEDQGFAMSSMLAQLKRVAGPAAYGPGYTKRASA